MPHKGLVVCIAGTVFILSACVSSGSSVSSLPENPPLSNNTGSSKPPSSGSRLSKRQSPSPKPKVNTNGLDYSPSSYIANHLKQQILSGNLDIKDSDGSIKKPQDIATLEDLNGKTLTATINSGIEQIKFTIEKGGLKRERTRANNSTISLTYLQENSHYRLSIGRDSDFDNYDRQAYKGKDLLFTDLPSSGTAKYKGGAIAQESGKSNFIKGTFELDVDFGNKKITGGKIVIPPSGSDAQRTIVLKGTNGSKEAKIEELPIDPTTKVNQYRGDAEEGSKKGSYQGEFFGNNAAETAGSVRFHITGSSSSERISFGGKKQ